ncbi:oligosaccharide flippase family protein [Leptolyngbya sp. FACHB-261]|uniref:oligosaccharide flippase family protein n=1 Tax=Leptolyngbya sp. FACHB-261 TaxID=2692806 RepID=UPI0016879306|nr:oligosaccharide flippase family protein [Leptolyngbya sp. FACHB-261]MBD2101740.1 oligosaccharide flippase family protein [Leptolyngbya sp. FACHB-261]
MSSFLTKAVKNSTWTGIGSLGTAILGFLFAGTTIRWLGEAEAGFAIAISTIAGINNTFSGLGLGAAATRVISRAYAENDTETIKKVTGVCFSVSLAFGLLGFLLFTGGASAIVGWAKYEGDPTKGQWYCILAGLFFLFSQISNYFIILLTSIQRFDWEAKLVLAFNLANGLGGLILLRMFPSILTIGFTLTTVSAIQALSGGLIVAKLFGFYSLPSWHKATFLELWSFGRWMYLTQIMGSLANGLDKVFLVSLFGSASLPFYTFAQRIYQTVHTTLVSQAKYLFPMLAAQGKEIDIVAERTEERLCWFISLIASLIYSGLIIAGPALMTVIVNIQFARNAAFQLFIFSCVGYIQAYSIVPFFFGLSKGDAKGNWIYQTITGVGILPLIILSSLVLGFKYAVLGNLMILVGVIYLARRGKAKVDWQTFMFQLVSPLYSSLLIMGLACVIHLVLTLQNATVITQFVAMGAFYLLVLFSIARLEQKYLGGRHRLETLGRALSLILSKLGLPSEFFLRILGIPVLSK